MNEWNQTRVQCDGHMQVSRCRIIAQIMFTTITKVQVRYWDETVIQLRAYLLIICVILGNQRAMTLASLFVMGMFLVCFSLRLPRTRVRVAGNITKKELNEKERSFKTKWNGISYHQNKIRMNGIREKNYHYEITFNHGNLTVGFFSIWFGRVLDNYEQRAG